jgi:hypothetical protein
MLREVVRWRSTVGAGILRSSAIELKTMAQLPRLAEFEYRYFQERVGRISVSHSDQNDVI